MITKQESYTKIECLESGHVQLRLTTKIIEDGKIISESHNRSVVDPDSDIGKLPANIQAVCKAHWNEEMMAEWNINKQLQQYKLQNQ